MRRDEKLHMYLVMAGAALIVVILRIQFNPIGWQVFHWSNWDCGLAAFIGTVVAIGKEVVWDKLLGKGTPQFYDAVFGVIGAFIGPFIVLLTEAMIVEVIPAIF